MVHWVREVGAFCWRWSGTYETGSLQTLEVLSFDYSQEVELIHAALLVLSEAALVLRWVAKDGTFTILKHLSTFIIHLKIFGFRLQEFLVSGRARLITLSASL